MYTDLNLMDSISEHHVQLRKLYEKLWDDQSDLYISNSEWLILAIIYREGQTTISFITRQVDISRQATHKFIKNLEDKDLVLIDNLENNKREKCIELTELGIQCIEKGQQIKDEIERNIKENIGTKKFTILLEILHADWGI